MANNSGNLKWIVSLVATVSIAAAGWIFGGVNAKSAADHRLLLAQDELLYKRVDTTERTNMVQEARITELERKMEIFGVKLDQILEILRSK